MSFTFAQIQVLIFSHLLSFPIFYHSLCFSLTHTYTHIYIQTHRQLCMYLSPNMVPVMPYFKEESKERGEKMQSRFSVVSRTSYNFNRCTI